MLLGPPAKQMEGDVLHCKPWLGWLLPLLVALMGVGRRQVGRSSW